MIILTRIPNISKWKQIFARVIRTRSHALLPLDKQHAKIYTMIIETPEERNEYKKQLHGLSYEERYYKTRSILNEDIDRYIKKLSEACIGNILFNNPKSYKFHEREKQLASDLFISDLGKEINLIVNRIMFNTNTKTWSLDTLIKRIKDPNLSVSFLNLSVLDDEIITNLLLKNKLVSLFEYKNSRDTTLYAQFRSDQSYYMNSDSKLSTFDFAQLENINMNKSNINNLMKMLENEKAITNILILLSKIVKLTRRKYEVLQNYKIFWDTMYNIGNEFYEDDEVNFIYNHCRKNRNRSKFVGCYYGQEIILRNGTSKIINYAFPVVSQLKGLPYRFKISCLALTESSPFYIHVNVIKITESKTDDKRKEAKGLVCTSMNINELHQYFPRIDVKLHKKTYCNELLYELCELQNEHKDVKFVYTPFEK